MSRLLIISTFLIGGLFLANTHFHISKSRTGDLKVPSVMPALDTQRVVSNYMNFCGGCHGEKMDAFVDRVWKHGNTRLDLFKAIKNGYADEGMPAFDSAFSDEDIYALSDYILTGIENVKRYEFKETVARENLFTSEEVNVRLDTVATIPGILWGMAFLPDGKILVTEKKGSVYEIGKKGRLRKVEGVPEVLSDGQGGLLDIAIHPDFRKNKYVYLSYSAFKTEGSRKVSTTKIIRAKLDKGRLVDQQTIFEALPYSSTRHHYGSRLLFGKDGYLYFSVGERGNEKENPQSLTNDLGKIHRVKDDGSIPADNPFVNTPGARPSIYSYGHRNPQGLALNPTTGEIWENEHGPRGGDEINLVKKGANYGWPIITYGINYNGKIISNKSAQEGMEQPLLYWIPSIGPSGMAFVQGKRYKGWEGNLLSGSLRFKYLNLSFFDGTKVEKEEMLLKNIGRLRDVRMGPDGFIYVSVENPGYIFRLVPVKK